jgi:lipid II:glycine glycyltransferase (peptidoglycan interpeptide bridge formation enzyme)
LLLDHVKKEIDAGIASFMELKGWNNNNDLAHLGMVPWNYNLDYILDLNPGPEELNSEFHDNVRRGIRQAEKRGVTSRISSTVEDLDIFYNLHVITRKKLGVIPQPHAFFENLYRYLISQNLGFVVLAECEGKNVAGIVFLTHKDTIYYKFNASDEEYLNRRPNHLITWEAIRYACANRYKFLDFGRCTPEEAGLRTYKARWGAKEINLPYYYYPEVRGVTSIPEGTASYKAMGLFSRIAPRWLFEKAGSVLYKHLG